MTHPMPTNNAVTRKFALRERVTKTKGSKWTGRVVGFYSSSLTEIGYAVESETEVGSVQIYPESALQLAPINAVSQIAEDICTEWAKQDSFADTESAMELMHLIQAALSQAELTGIQKGLEAAAKDLEEAGDSYYIIGTRGLNPSDIQKG